MFAKLLMLAQDVAEEAIPVAQPVQEIQEKSTIFNLTNLILVLAIFAILIGYKVYRDRTMK